MSQSGRNVWPALHGGLLLTALLVAGLLPLSWPWQLALPLAAYIGLALLLPPLRRTMPAFRFSRLDRVGTVGSLLVSGGAAVVLLAYQHWFHPTLAQLADRLPAILLEYAVLGGLCFSLVNAVLEELMCRWALYDALAEEWGVPAAIAVTSAFFGFAHLDGYPPGPLGAVLAGLFGVCLALLRWWSGGLTLSISCHVCADAVIFWIICSR